LGENTNSIKKNTQAQLYASKELGVYIGVLSPECSTHHNIKIANKSFETVENCRYLGMTVTDENCIHDEIKYRLNSGNACYLALQNLFSSCLLVKSLKKNKIYKIIILSLVLYEYEIWSVNSREENRMRTFENRMLRRIFGHKGRK
jgi:hypothetical protein